MKDKTLLSLILEDKHKIRLLRCLLEAIEVNKDFVYKLLYKYSIRVNTPFVVLEEFLPEDFPKDFLDELESIGIIRRHPVFRNVIELVGVDRILEAIELVEKKSEIKEEEAKVVKRSAFEKERSKLNLLSYLLPYTAPSLEDVQGLDKVKKAIILQIFSAKDLPNLRNRIHILLIGDPGTGKTLALKWVTDVTGGIFRSLRVTAAGLSGSLRASIFEEQGSLLQKADGKILALDEIDKMKKEDLDPLLSAMEEGKVTLTGAEVDIVYNARVRVIAAANRDVFRPEFKDRFDYIKYLRKPTKRELARIIGRIVDFAALDSEGRSIIVGKRIFRRLLEEVKDFQPKIIDRVGVFQEISNILNKMYPVTDTVRQTQKWLRFAYAFARLHKTNINGEIVKRVYEELVEK